ncbi:MAG TPA: hypothetical protein VN366_02155 [Feifaniaceae bacterium]|nr:hypothetical protein [Feifaniaceae bacterium]
MSTWQTSTTQYLLNQVALSNSIRRLWVNNNQWIRALTYSILYGIGDRQAIEQRLAQNAEDFSTLFTQFYGQDVGNRVRANYNSYIQSLARMIEAYRDNDLSAVASRREELNRISDDLAQIFARINRYWDLATIQALIRELMDLTQSQIIRIMSGEFSQSIQDYDQAMEQAYRVSDELTTGILKQFQV